MKRYPLSGVEHVHMIRHVPRSYDMTRTHILHKSVNQHVDVVLRCSPKHWKKKKVQVHLVKGEKKTAAAKIRANARKGYVAVRKESHEAYEADRRRAAAVRDSSVQVVQYTSPADRSLIRDMKSQIAAMAQKSADYIDRQLTAHPPVAPSAPQPAVPVKSAEPASQAAAAKTAVEAEVKESAALLSKETERILEQGGYKRSRPLPSNPYAADYTAQLSNAEFRRLMDSLERSLDETCSKYVIPTDAVEAEKPHDAAGLADERFQPVTPVGRDLLSQEAPIREMPSFPSAGQEVPPQTVQPSVPSAEDDEEEYVRPVSLFATEPQEPPVSHPYFDDPAEPAADGVALPMEPPVVREDTFAPVTTFPTEQMPAGEMFTSEPLLREEPAPLPERLRSDAPVDRQGPFDPAPYFPDEEQEPFRPMPQYGEEEEEPFRPMPQYGEEEEPFRAMPQYDEEEEEPFRPMPQYGEEEEEPFRPMPQYDEEEGYSPAPVSPDRNEPYVSQQEYPSAYQPDDSVVGNRTSKRLFSRADGQIKKVIGTIKGKFFDRHNDEPHPANDGVEVTYSDRDDSY